MLDAVLRFLRTAQAGPSFVGAFVSVLFHKTRASCRIACRSVGKKPCAHLEGSLSRSAQRGRRRPNSWACAANIPKTAREQSSPEEGDSENAYSGGVGLSS